MPGSSRAGSASSTTITRREEDFFCGVSLTCAREAIAFVAGEAGAKETAQGVCALCENVARSILALVFVCRCTQMRYEKKRASQPLTNMENNGIKILPGIEQPFPP